MTDMHIAYLVTLERPIHVDAAEASVLLAIQSIRGVATVEPLINDLDKQLAMDRARRELIKKLWDVLWEKR